MTVAKLTDYHAKYFAYELTRRCPSDSVERIASTLMDSQVDLNPHQVDAALFALRSPLSKGALLADEVGLGKTIEAGIVLAQKWAERKRKILLVLPSSLRKQWYQELQDKFYLPSRILESGSFNKAVKQGVANPFEADEIVICSYPFARNKAEFLRKVPWDLVVMDEAHRLRNVYKPGNKIANELKKALEHAPKLLLTATPLQNSLLELYGLVSFIDEHVFGDLKSYKAQFSRLTGDDAFNDLKKRLEPVCKRTLRRQVQPYISYTERQAYYVLQLLSENGYDGKIVLFNGTNSDPIAKQIYTDWKVRNEGTDKISGSRTADTRAALVEHFRNNAQIMIATEAAAEGINLQFCSLVVNYDLPWNPQRIEQRIGRCHRYGQKHDVVVVNFLNRNNAADQRVFELLSEKFQLFKGVFGASDEVLGAIESGVDFEKRIVEIYQSCRTSEQIQEAFDLLQAEMGGEIDESIKSTRQKLLEHFDTEVAEKLKVYDAQSKEALSRYEALLWRMTRHLLAGQAEFDDEKLCFAYDSQRFSLKSIVNRQSEIVNGSHQYRLNHPLAQKLIKEAKEQELAPVEITFDYTGSGKNISILKPLVGKSGTLTAQFFSVSALEAEDYILFGALTDNGKQLDDEQCRRLFDLPGEPGARALQKSLSNTKILEKKQKDLLGEISERNAVFFDEEMEKLEKWAEDRRVTLKVVLKEQDELIKELKKEARRAHSLPDKLGLQKKIRDLQKKTG